MRALPDDGWSAKDDGVHALTGEWREGGVVRHGFTHFDLELQLMLCLPSQAVNLPDCRPFLPRRRGWRSLKGQIEACTISRSHGDISSDRWAPWRALPPCRAWPGPVRRPRRASLT
ncbi:MAG: hypothetical protein VW891_17190 [Novosphingobium sp.]